LWKGATPPQTNPSIIVVGSGTLDDTLDWSISVKKVYPWPRFWSPQGAELTLFSNAYLPDPEDAYARFHNQNVSTFKAMSADKCNVLLA
jgi:hypothetical protein